MSKRLLGGSRNGRARGGTASTMLRASPIACEPLECRQLLNAGDLDTTFNDDGKATLFLGNNVTLQAEDVAVQSDGKVVVAGTANTQTSTASFDSFEVVRFNVDGTLDTSFGGGDGISAYTFLGSSWAEAAAVAIQADGKIVVVGSTDNRMAIVRFDAAGALD